MVYFYVFIKFYYKYWKFLNFSSNIFKFSNKILIRRLWLGPITLTCGNRPSFVYEYIVIILVHFKITINKSLSLGFLKTYLRLWLQVSSILNIVILKLCAFRDLNSRISIASQALFPLSHCRAAHCIHVVLRVYVVQIAHFR